MDMLVMPSRYETLSNAVLEAMACGVPFVASEVGGSKDLAKTRAGWLFEPESVSSLVHLLTSIIGDRAELRARGERGSRHVRQHYSWQASARSGSRTSSHAVSVSAYESGRAHPQPHRQHGRESSRSICRRRRSSICYYFWVFYSIMGSALGISIDLLGIGMLVVLAAFCILRMGRQAPTLLGPIGTAAGVRGVVRGSPDPDARRTGDGRRDSRDGRTGCWGWSSFSPLRFDEDSCTASRSRWH